MHMMTCQILVLGQNTRGVTQSLRNINRGQSSALGGVVAHRRGASVVSQGVWTPPTGYFDPYSMAQEHRSRPCQRQWRGTLTRGSRASRGSCSSASSTWCRPQCRTQLIGQSCLPQRKRCRESAMTWRLISKTSCSLSSLMTNLLRTSTASTHR